MYGHPQYPAATLNQVLITEKWCGSLFVAMEIVICDWQVGWVVVLVNLKNDSWDRCVTN